MSFHSPYRTTASGSPAMLVTRDGIITALSGLTQDETERLARTWRHNLRAVEEDILFIGEHRRTIAERDDRLSSGHMVHKAGSVARARQLLPWRLSLYLEHVKAASLAEGRMIDGGIEFSRSSDAWVL